MRWNARWLVPTIIGFIAALAAAAPVLAQDGRQVGSRGAGLTWRIPEDALPRVLRTPAERQQIRGHQIGIITGQPGGVYARLGADLVRLLDDRSNASLRVVAIIGGGSISNIDDLLNLRGVDFAILQGDVLEAYGDTPAGRDLRIRMRYVSRLHTEVLHILSRRGVIDGRAPTVCVLDGKRINVGGPLTGTSVTARTVLQGILGLRITYDPSTSTNEGIEQLKAGTVDAVAYVVGKPATLFERLSAADVAQHGLELLEITPDLLVQGCNERRHGELRVEEDTVYEEAVIDSRDYPSLVVSGRTVMSVGIPSILAAYGWTENQERFGQAQAFVRSFFAQSGRLANPQAGYATNWCGIDLTREVRNWQRFSAAETWIAEWSRTHPGQRMELDCNHPAASLCHDPESLRHAFDRSYAQAFPEMPRAGQGYLRAYEDFKQRTCP